MRVGLPAVPVQLRMAPPPPPAPRALLPLKEQFMTVLALASPAPLKRIAPPSEPLAVLSLKTQLVRFAWACVSVKSAPP